MVMPVSGEPVEPRLATEGVVELCSAFGSTGSGPTESLYPHPAPTKQQAAKSAKPSLEGEGIGC